MELQKPVDRRFKSDYPHTHVLEAVPRSNCYNYIPSVPSKTILDRGFHAVLAVLLFTALILTAAGAAAQTTYSLSVSTDQSSYAGSQTIQITGSVSPAPGPSTAVTLKLISPDKTVLGVWEAPVGASTGLFNYSLVAGGSSSWIAGTFTVNATWGAYPPQLYKQTTFAWSPPVTTTTTTTTTSTTTTTTTPTTTTTTTTTTTSTTTTTTTTPTTTTTTTTTTSGGGGIPDFPFQAASVGVLVVAMAVGYLLVRKSSLAGRRLTSP